MSIFHHTAAGPGLFSPLVIGLLVGIVVSFLLLALCVGFIRRYRKRFLIFSKKCAVLEPQLEKTRRELNVINRLFKQESERRVRMLDGAGAAVFQLNEHGECVYVNAALGNLSGFSEQRLYEYGLRDAVHPEDRPNVRGKWMNFATQEPPYESSYRLMRQDGNIVHVMERGSVLMDDQQRIIGYLGQLMDVSDLVHARSEARTAERRGSRFIQQTAGGFYKLDLDEPVPLNLPIKEISDLIYERAKLTACCADLAAFYGRPARELTGTAFKELKGGCGFFDSPDRFRRFAEEKFMITGEEEVRTDYRGTPICLSYDVVGMVENDQLVAIWGTQHDVSLQKREKEESTHREEFLRRILDTLPGDVFVKDPRCRYLYVSRGFEDRTDIPVDDWLQKTVFEVLPAAPRDTNKSSIQAMKSGQLCRKVDGRSGSVRQEWVETFEKPLVSDEGVVEGVVGISIDVTDQVVRQKSLEQKEARFRHLVEHNPAGIILTDASSKTLTYANPAFCDLFGYTDGEISALKVDDLHSPGSRRQVLAEWNERARQAQHFTDALPCMRKDRSIIFAEVGVSVGSLDGSEQVIGVYSDAAGRRQVETELEHQRDLQASLLSSASVLVATVDCAGTIRSANDALLELLGRDESDLVGLPFVDALVCAEDRTLLSSAFMNHEPGLQKDYEVRLASLTETLHAVSCRVQTGVDLAGEASGFTISGMDLTAGRALEQQLRDECDGFRDRLAACEDKLSETSESYRQSELVRESLVREHKQLEDTLAGRVQQFRKTLTEREQREAELTGLIHELETRKIEQVEVLEARRKIEDLKETLKQLRAREADLISECSRLNGDLSKAEKELQSRMEELAAGRSEWDAESDRLNDLRRELEEMTAEQATQLEQMTGEHAGLKCELKAGRKELEAERSRVVLQVKNSSAGLQKKIAELQATLQARTEELKVKCSEWDAETDRQLGFQRNLEKKSAELAQKLQQVSAERVELGRELKVSRKEAEFGLKTIHVQVKQGLAPLKQELKELQARKKQLETAQEKSSRRLAELETLLTERAQELKTVAHARKEGGESFFKTQKDLKKQLQMRSSKIDKLLKQTESDAVERGKAEERWKKDKNSLLARTQELEGSLRERTHELTFAVVAGREKEEAFTNELRELKNQIKQKTKELTQESDVQREREDKLNAEQKELSGCLNEVQRALDKRSEEVAELQTTRQELEEMVALEKESLAHRISLFKEEMNDCRKAEQAWQQREDELQGAIATVEKQLKQQVDTVAYETEARKKTEQQVARLKIAAASDHRMIYDLTEDLSDPLRPVLELSNAILTDGDLPVGAYTPLREINRCAERLQSILSYRRELACLEDGSVRAEPEWFDFDTFLKELSGNFTERAEQKNLFFTVSREGTFPGKLFADQATARQLLSALYDRALHGTQKGQVGLHIICDAHEDRHKQIAFLLTYKGIGEDSALTKGLADSADTRRPCGEMSDDEFQLDLIQRKAQMLGGSLCIKNRSERQPVLSFVLPVEQQLDAHEDDEIPKGSSALLVETAQ